jgi:predicted cupin superfamily sugar epimerase
LIKLYAIDNHGNLSTYFLGNPLEYAGASFQVSIRADNYFAAEVLDKNSYTLVGCTVSPGFEFKDFELIDRVKFIEKFPQHSDIINQFSREYENLIKKTSSNI